MLDDLRGQLVAESELLEDVRVGRVAGLGLLDGGQLELLEQDVRHLLGRPDVEFLSGQPVDLAGEPLQGQIELLGEVLEARWIHADAVALHGCEHGHERLLEIFIQGVEAHFLEGARQHLPDLPDPARAAARRGQSGSLAQELRADLGKLVARARGIEEVRAHRHVVEGGRSATGQPPFDHVLDVVPDEAAAAEIRRFRPELEDGGARGGMIDAEQRKLRLRRPSLADPIHRHGIAGGDIGQPLPERLGSLKAGQRLGDRGRRLRGGELAQQGLELELRPEPPETLPVRLLALEGVEVLGDGHARAHGGQLAGEERLLAMGGERLPHLALHEGEVLVEPLHAAELGDELDRRLLADSGHAGNVVDGVAHEGEEIGNLLGTDPPLGGDRLVVEPDRLTAHVRGEHAHAGADELKHVLVGGDEHHLHRLAPHPVDQRAQHIVGLEARYLEEGQPERLEDALDEGDLAAEIVGHARTRLLVRRELLLAKGGARRIPRHRRVRRVLLAEQLQEHGGHSAHGVGRLALGVGEIGEGMIGAVEKPRPVHHEEPRAHAGTTRS